LRCCNSRETSQDEDKERYHFVLLVDMTHLGINRIRQCCFCCVLSEFGARKRLQVCRK
jgi:hypothetical protein